MPTSVPGTENEPKTPSSAARRRPKRGRGSARVGTSPASSPVPLVLPKVKTSGSRRQGSDTSFTPSCKSCTSHPRITRSRPRTGTASRSMAEHPGRAVLVLRGSGTPVAFSASMPSSVSSLRDRSSTLEVSRRRQRGQQLRPLVADPAVPQVEHLQPIEQAGVDDLLDAVVAEHGQAQPQVRQLLQVRRAGERLQPLERDGRLTLQCVRVAQQVRQVRQRGVLRQLLQRVVEAVVELRTRRFGIGRAKSLCPSTSWANRYSSSSRGIWRTSSWTCSPLRWHWNWQEFVAVDLVARPAELEDAQVAQVRPAQTASARLRLRGREVSRSDVFVLVPRRTRKRSRRSNELADESRLRRANEGVGTADAHLADDGLGRQAARRT